MLLHNEKMTPEKGIFGQKKEGKTATFREEKGADRGGVLVGNEREGRPPPGTKTKPE